MDEPTFDRDGYPTDETLDAIRDWSYLDFPALMEFVSSAWSDYGYFGRHEDFDPPLLGLLKGDQDDGNWWTCATGGWSGNESLIAALSANAMFDALCWQASVWGGYHEYHFPSFCIGTTWYSW